MVVHHPEAPRQDAESLPGTRTPGSGQRAMLDCRTSGEHREGFRQASEDHPNRGRVQRARSSCPTRGLRGPEIASSQGAADLSSGDCARSQGKRGAGRSTSLPPLLSTVGPCVPRPSR